ncbi:SIMPL domain-containing protein [Parvularcula dongshanensis]|uniref:SIMPL domain-containing protein n=1 Tax=Parvularcula dongshanensis TaxID=1173995 RepID=A0A840I3T3_9PROT|nr:SIMPL domain-containing protein [Parvularcula dongshanensis]MBB4658838.1 hypothetical protein [Parvularcula dongshanensis]
MKRAIPLIPLLLCLPLAAHAQEPAPRTLSVSGLGEATGTPDMATLRFSATSRAATAAEALAANAQKMTAVRDRLRTLNIEPRDMQTSGLSLSPYYEQNDNGRFDRAVIAGYEAANGLTIRLRGTEGAGDVIDAAVQAGANGLDSLSFGFQNADSLQDDARRDAVRDARAKAELLAEEAGVSLGRVLTLTEAGGGGGPQPYYDGRMMRMQAEAAPTPVEAGEQAVTASVQITYELR